MGNYSYLATILPFGPSDEEEAANANRLGT